MKLNNIKFIKKRIIAAIILVCTLLFMIFGYVIYESYIVKYESYIVKHAETYNIDKRLVMSIIKAESKFDRNARSNKDAMGLMQIMKVTAEWANEELKKESLEESDIYDVDTNIEIGCWYLDRLNKLYEGDITLMAAAYNAGIGNVSKWLLKGTVTEDNIPFPETKKYVKKVKLNYEVYKKIYKGDHSK